MQNGPAVRRRKLGAELRTLRGKRRRKVALRSGIGTLAIAVGVAALA